MGSDLFTRTGSIKYIFQYKKTTMPFRTATAETSASWAGGSPLRLRDSINYATETALVSSQNVNSQKCSPNIV